MMRERLVKLIKHDNCISPATCSSKCKYVDSDDCHAERLADYLLANGVIVLSEANVVAYKKENTITPECITQALELLKSHAVIPDFRREVAFAHLLAEEKLKGEKE